MRLSHFASYRAIIVRYPFKISTKEVCDTIATSIARDENIAAGRPGPVRRELLGGVTLWLANSNIPACQASPGTPAMHLSNVQLHYSCLNPNKEMWWHVSRQKVGHGSVVYGIAKFQALIFTFQA